LGIKSSGGSSGGVTIGTIIIQVTEKADTTSEEQSKLIGNAIKSQLKTLVQQELVGSVRSGGTLNPTAMAANF
jgi:hypothetical protein